MSSVLGIRSSLGREISLDLAAQRFWESILIKQVINQRERTAAEESKSLRLSLSQFKPKLEQNANSNSLICHNGRQM